MHVLGIRLRAQLFVFCVSTTRCSISSLHPVPTIMRTALRRWKPTTHSAVKKHKTCTIILFHMSCHTDIMMLKKEMDGAVVEWMDGWKQQEQKQEHNEIKRTAFQFIHRTWNLSKIREKSTRALVRCSLYSFPHLPFHPTIPRGLSRGWWLLFIHISISDNHVLHNHSVLCSAFMWMFDK